MEKKNIIIIISSIIIVVVFIFFLISKKVEYQNSVPTQNKVKTVKDYSKYFAVSDCVNKYLEYISTSNSKSLMNIVNEKYKSDNNIDNNNIIKKLDIYSINNKSISFKAKKMYEIKITNKIYTYYVYGELYEEMMDNIKKINDYYFIVNVNYDNLIFDIMPDNGKVFEEKKNER